MPSSLPRTRLEQRVQAAHLSLREFQNRYQQVARQMGESAYVSDRQAKRWLAGNIASPRPVVRRVLERWFGESIDVLLGAPVGDSPLTMIDPGELLMTAGRESAKHALHAASALDPAAMEALHADIARLARAYYTTPPLALLTDLIGLREIVQTQLDRTRKPLQQAELYLIAGEICGLLASVAFDLGRPNAAEELARAAFTYGSVIDHPSLCAWARALTMSVLLWSGQYRQVVSVANAAAEHAPEGTSKARLFAVRARAWAYLGAADHVAADLTESLDEMDRAGRDDLVDEVGGELGFDRARRGLCAGAAYVALRDGQQAATEAQTAVDSFVEQPDSVRWVAGELSARVDLATARALAGDLAGAETALRPVVVLSPARRTEALAHRMSNLGRLVAGAPYRGAREAVRIGEVVDDFTADALRLSATSVELPTPLALPGS